MSDQSDTPRVEAAAERGSSLGLASTAWSGIWPLARDLERELATATRERDEARAALRSIAEDSADKHSRECARSALAATEPKP